MNTIQAQTNVSPTSGSGPHDVANSPSKLSTLNVDQVSSKADHYSATAANDVVVARVISSSLGKSFSYAGANEQSGSALNNLSDRFSTQAQNDEAIPNIQTVTKNVVGFVEGALANLAKQGFDEEKLSFFRNEAVKGVEVGIDQAKLDLIGLANDDVFRTIDSTRDSIIDGINRLPTNPNEYNASLNDAVQRDNIVQEEFAAIRVNTSSGTNVTIDFETRAFNESNFESGKSIHTTSSSNISFALHGSVDDSSHQKIADLLNKTDSLANSFYRGDIENAYNKSVELGYSDNEILGLAKQLNQGSTQQQLRMYEDIEHLAAVTTQSDLAAPKAVADYVNRYLDVMESSKETFKSEKDFNQVINGLVNQMKDVQVPDLLQAINRFHAFNNKFN
jgi:hypothetical protein